MLNSHTLNKKFDKYRQSVTEHKSRRAPFEARRSDIQISFLCFGYLSDFIFLIAFTYSRICFLDVIPNFP